MSEALVTAILLAAGASSRMGENKLAMRFSGYTPLELSYKALVESDADRIIITVSDDTREYAKKLISDKPTKVISGGVSRLRSVYNALCACDSTTDIVIVHDAARCLVTPKLINTSIEEARVHKSAIATTGVRDTLRRRDSHEKVDRDSYLAMQTPQTFDYERIRFAYDRIIEGGAATEAENTDDCGCYIDAGFTPHYFEAGISNQKLTYPGDVELFSAITAHRERGQRQIGRGSNMRIGYGEDTHRLCEGRRLVIGGEEIDYRMGLLGHSDADVLCHAVSDALLGAAALGDIGVHFPDTDDGYKDANSIFLLGRVGELLFEKGYTVVNIDATVVAQEPRLAEHIPAMRENIANALNISMDRVSVKATTPEHTGPEGRLECITVRAVALICGE